MLHLEGQAQQALRSIHVVLPPMMTQNTARRTSVFIRCLAASCSSSAPHSFSVASAPFGNGARPAASSALGSHHMPCTCKGMRPSFQALQASKYWEAGGSDKLQRLCLKA